MKNSQYQTAKLMIFCNEKLAELINNTKGIHTVVVASIDGFHISSVVNDGHMKSTNRLSAVGSSLLALSTSISKELGLKNCQSIEINTDMGRIWISPIQHKGISLIFLVQSNEKLLHGELLFNAKKTRYQIEYFLSH